MEESINPQLEENQNQFGNTLKGERLKHQESHIWEVKMITL